MSADDNLPVILVSAVDAAAASALITELMNEGAEGPQCNGVGHSDEEEPSAPVWRLTNKYYSAAVRLRALPDGRAPPARDDVQAHIIYLTEDECSDSSACAGRWAAAGAGAGAVRLLAARAAGAPAPLAAWARARRYELVPLLAPPAPAPDSDPDDDDFPEARGAARLREALHAHVWPGLRRAAPAPHPAPHPAPAGDSSAESSDDEWGEWRRAGGEGAEEEEGAVRRAELFADALALLPGRGGGAGAGGDTADTRPTRGDDATRRLHAEQVVAAFCRALGHELRLDDDEGVGEREGDGEGEASSETRASVGQV